MLPRFLVRTCPSLAGRSRCLLDQRLLASPLAGIRSASSYTPDKYKREWAIWRKLDLDHDGKVTFSEIETMCQHMDMEDHATFLQSYLDIHGDGKVTFDEFCIGFQAVLLMRVSAMQKMWHRTFGLGVAGNVAGHMEQAGEAGPSDAGASPPKTPAGVFAFYVPKPDLTVCESQETSERAERLSAFPVTNAVVTFPDEDHGVKGASRVQVEPEIGLYCDVVYSKDRQKVERLVPRRLCAFNDCSIRALEGSDKLSQRKNWGRASKGMSTKNFRVDDFSKGGKADDMVLLSYVKRGNDIHLYSAKAPARTYLMYNNELLDWIVDQLNNQQTEGNFENVSELLRVADNPTSMYIALGAGEYTEWGQTNFVQIDDECLVIVYDETVHADGPDDALVSKMFNDDLSPDGMCFLHQTFV